MHSLQTYMHRYQVMLECWNEYPQDRPTFSQLRSKFSDMLLATTTDTYMVLEVDDQKAYYTMEEEDDEKRKRSDSTSSSDSSSSIKKPKEKKIQKPVWSKPVNQYIDTPSNQNEISTQNATVVSVEHHNISSDGEEDEYDRRGMESAYADQPALRSVPEMSDTHSSEPQQGYEEIEERHISTGIPMSLLSEEKPSSHHSASHSPVHSIKSNPYVEAPGKSQLLPDQLLHDSNSSQM